LVVKKSRKKPARKKIRMDEPSQTLLVKDTFLDWLKDPSDILKQPRQQTDKATTQQKNKQLNKLLEDVTMKPATDCFADVFADVWDFAEIKAEQKKNHAPAVTINPTPEVKTKLRLYTK
jgi:hypothetical protein